MSDPESGRARRPASAQASALRSNRRLAADLAERRERIAARLFTAVLYGCCMLFLLVMGGLAVELLWGSRLSLAAFGPGFLWSTEWNPVRDRFGAAPFLYGTVVSSLIALLLAGSVGILAAVPSIVYGLWGLFVLAPVVSGGIGPALQAAFGFLPIFRGPIYGVNMLT